MSRTTRFFLWQIRLIKPDKTAPPVRKMSALTVFARCILCGSALSFASDDDDDGEE